jgi:hypothetical protein
MDSKFPGLDSHIAEEKLRNIENSINRSLLDNSEKPSCKMKPCYIILFIFIGASAALITYACVKLF